MKRSHSSSWNGRSDSNKKAKSTREEINEIMETVKEFNSKSLEGIKKKAHKEDRLTKLGAPPPKQQKMPFSMRLGLKNAKKKRDVREAEAAKEAQIQLPQFKTSSKKRRK
jgi:hypothetical protein